jgi:hypothetical protein
MTDHDFETFLLQIALHQHSDVKNSFALSTATYQTITISSSFEQVLGVRAKVAATIFGRLGKDLQNTWTVGNSFFPGRNAALVNRRSLVSNEHQKSKPVAYVVPGSIKNSLFINFGKQRGIYRETVRYIICTALIKNN